MGKLELKHLEMMNVKDLKNAMLANSYILLRYPSGVQIGCNCSIVNTKHIQKIILAKNSEEELKFVSYRACGFHEYLSKKIPFRVIN